LTAPPSWFLSRMHMLELTTKQRPSIPMVRISGSHVSLPSAVGAR
jgi:hypothetical protein